MHETGRVSLHYYVVSLRKTTSRYLLIPSQQPSRHLLLKRNNRNTRTRYKICSKLTIETLERRQWHSSGIFIVNFEHISNFVLVFLLLTL